MTRSGGQMSLFEQEAAAAADAALLGLSRRLPDHVIFGTSSWTFEGWKEEVYFERYRSKRAFLQDSLKEYAQYPLFGTVGIDSSYYRPTSIGTLQAWADQLPEGFPCVMKVWSELSTMVFPRHARFGARAGEPNHGFLNPDIFTKAIHAPVQEAFAEHLDTYLVAIPPMGGRVDLDFFLKRLVHFLEAAPPGFRYAFELREPALLCDGYFAVLRELGATHVYNYWSRMPSLSEQLEATRGVPSDSTVVVRLMLPPGCEYQDLKERWAPFDRIQQPRPEMRRHVMNICDAAKEVGSQVRVIVNNKAEGSSPQTIRALASLLAQEGLDDEAE